MGLLATGDHLRNTLVVLIFFARLGDIGSTYLATPNLKMEANPLMRLGGWRLALVTVLACLIPFYDVGLGMTMLVLSLMVTGSNLSKGWMMRTLGEAEYQDVMRSAARRSSLPVALGFILGSAAFVGLAGVVLMAVSGGSAMLAYWAASGVALYALAMGVYGTISAVRLFRSVSSSSSA